MKDLYIDLQRGFQRETVLIRINETEVLRVVNVETIIALGHAYSWEGAVNEADLHVEVELVERALSGSVGVPGYSTAYLGVSCNDEHVHLHVSDVPFDYMA